MHCNTVVITGCLGFMGSHLTRELLRKGIRVLGIDNQTYAANLDCLEEFNSSRRFTYWNKDISTLDRLPDCDVVINMAAESHVCNSINNSSSFTKTNIDGVHNLLELIRYKADNSTNRPRLIHVSTDEVYGDRETGSFHEDDMLSPSNPYAATKASGDMMILAWARTYGINFNIVRPTNNYGTEQYHEKLIPLSVRLLEENKKIKLHNSGTPVRTWLHVNDFVSAMMTVFYNGESNEIYNVGGLDEMQNIEAVKMIVDEYSSLTESNVSFEKRIDLSYERLGQDIRYSVNDKKLRKLGWIPTRLFKDNIRKIVDSYIIGEWRW